MMAVLSDLWLPDISVLDKVLRPILVYFFLLLALRLGGKRELGQLTGFDLVVLLMLSNSVQNAIIGNDDSVSGGVIGAATLLLTNYCVVRLAYRYPRVQRLVEGRPTLLLRAGQIIPPNLQRELITETELRTVLRRQGFENLAEINAAILETSGSITVERAEDLPTPVEATLLQRLDQIERLLQSQLHRGA